MTLQDMQMGWRLLLKNPGHSLVMVLSLTVGFAVWFLALGFTRFEFGFDRDVPRLEQVFVLKARANWGHRAWSENVPLAMKESLERSGVALQTTAVLPVAGSTRVGSVLRGLELTVADTAFTKVFGTRALEGDLDAVLARPDAVALTQETALAVYGDTHVVGRRLQVNGEPMQVGAVLGNPPRTSSLQFEALVGPASTAWSAQRRERAHDSWNYYSDDDRNFVSCKVFVRLPDPGRRAALLEAVERDVQNSPLRGHLSAGALAAVGTKPLLAVEMGPLADSYLDSDARENSGPKGDPIANYAMNGVALLILLLTAGNYINLANIRVVQRQREMAVRKVLGVRASQLAAQLVVESVVVSALAAVLGAGLAGLLLPAWSDLTEHDIAGALGGRDYAWFAVVVVASGVLVGIGAGPYPAWTAMRLRVTPSLNGRDGSDTASGLLLRRILTVLQFGIAMFVMAMIITVAWQIQFLKRIDYGYRVDGLSILQLPGELGKNDVDGLKSALEAMPEVQGVTRSSPHRRDQSFTTARGEELVLPARLVGPGYFDVVELKAAAGRVFDRRQDAGDGANVVVVNRLAALRLGFPKAAAAVGQFVNMNGKSVQIVGIANDVRNGFDLGPMSPLVYALSDTTPELTLRSNVGFTALQAAVSRLWLERLPSAYLMMRDQRTQLERNAGGPLAILQCCIVVGLVIVPLAVFSVYVLSAFVVQRRAREFVLRKLHGASSMDVVRLLLREFAALQGIAALVALPLAFVCGRGFVERFADQAPTGPWALAAALFSAALVAAVATSRHILAASRLTPAAVLRAA